MSRPGEAEQTPSRWSGRGSGKNEDKGEQEGLEGCRICLGSCTEERPKKEKHVSVKAQIRSVQRLLKKVTYVDSCL